LAEQSWGGGEDSPEDAEVPIVPYSDHVSATGQTIPYTEILDTLALAEQPEYCSYTRVWLAVVLPSLVPTRPKQLF